MPVFTDLSHVQVYHVDDLHFNPEYYPEPERWDPGRYLPEHEGRSPPLPFVGWGTGRHPCGESFFTAGSAREVLKLTMTFGLCICSGNEGQLLSLLPDHIV